MDSSAITGLPAEAKAIYINARSSSTTYLAGFAAIGATCTTRYLSPSQSNTFFVDLSALNKLRYYLGGALDA